MPVRTISRWPWSTRRRTSASTAEAGRLRDPPRTSGMTQKLHEKLQPSWILTNARTRSRRASACTQPSAPTSPATKSGVASLRRATTVTLSGRPTNASPARFAAQPVTKTRRCVRAARAAAWRDLRTASCVTQQVLTTATSVPPSVWPSASKRSRTSWASVCDTLQPRKRIEKPAIGRLLRGLVEVRRPAVPVDAPNVAEPVERGFVRRQVAGADEPAGTQAGRQRFQRRPRDVRNCKVGLRHVDPEHVLGAYRDVASI